MSLFLIYDKRKSVYGERLIMFTSDEQLHAIHEIQHGESMCLFFSSIKSLYIHKREQEKL
jgi:hypothetical protein